jgi:hypothetical protein
MTTTQILARIAPERREAARPIIEAHLPAMREMAAKLAPLMAQTRAIIAEMGR